MIKIFKFRKNDLNPSLGKQIEFNQNVVSTFFGFSKDEVEIYVTYRSLIENDSLNNKKFKNTLKLAEKRGDYKIYLNSDGTDNIKNLFINHLGLDQTNNIDDYFALKKNDKFNYDLYYLPNETSIASFFKIVDKNIFEYELDHLELNNNKIILEDKVLKNIIHITFKYLLSNFKYNKIKALSSEKESRLEDNTFTVLTFPKYFKTDAIVSFFDQEQNKEKLTSGGIPRYFDDNLDIENVPYSYFINQWYDTESDNKSLRNFNAFINDVSEGTLKIIKEEGIFKLIKKDNEINNTVKLSNKNLKNTNTIYYGAPGTGKSYKVDQIIKDLDKQFYERVTFHPEYDNASFIGGYKPVSVKDEDGNDVIKYEFVPQAFANIYKRAWQDLDNQYYLVIEEINRGNCAEIFGELFQLLDRNSGYTVAPSNELYKHLIEEFGDVNHEGIVKGLQLPPNLTILATMNTSDQSLFPMDSAFKRRWDWEYVPICYPEKNEADEIINESKSFNFVIDLENGTKYSWIKFIEFINLNHIKENPNLGMDKCIGNYFVKPEDGDNISLKQFINKVIFYLWNDVFKDEDNAVFEENSSYEDFFPITTKGLQKVTELFERIGLEKIKKITEEESTNIAAESQVPYGE